MSPLTGVILGQLGLVVAFIIQSIRIGGLERRVRETRDRPGMCTRSHRCRETQEPCNGWPR